MPTPVIVETSWLIESRLGPHAEAVFLDAVAAGELTRFDLTEKDWSRAAELVERYADLGPGLVDASVVVAAERSALGTSWKPLGAAPLEGGAAAS